MSAITAKASRKMKKYAVLTREPRCFLGSFDFSWEQRKLGDIADIVGGGTPSTGNQSYWDGDIDWYAPAEIADQIYANSSQKKITGLGYENSSAKMLPPGTVLFTSRAGIGKTAILTRKGCTNQGFQSIVPHRGELDSYFIFSRTEELKRYGELVGAGSTFVEVSGKQMAVMELMMPPTMREQQTIGGFFQQLDHLITLHQRKCVFLFGFFQAFISMIFTASTFSWEQRKLSELTSMHARIGWQNLRTSEFLDSGDYMLITGTDFNDGAINFSTCHYVERERYEQDRNIQIHNGSILITKDGTLGKVAYVQGLSMPATLNAGVFNVQIKDANIVDERYLFQYLKAPFLMDYVDKKATGGTIKHLNQSILVDFPVILPQRSEQILIGAFFQQLDNLITLHQRECISFTARAGRLILTANKKRNTSSWEQRKFSDITFPAGEKNKDNLPLESYSITNEHGFVPQDEKFENGGTMREADKRMYYIVSPNSFAYNPARINVGSIGYQNIGKNVIVSSLYEVFKTSEDVDDRLLWHWFKSSGFQKLIMQLQEGGVRLYFYYDKLCMGEVSIPSLDEQRKIGKLFDTLDNLITLHQRKPFLMKWRTSDANRNQTNRLVL